MFDWSGLEIASKFIAIFAIGKCFPINARTWREGSDVTEVRRLHQQHQVTCNATQNHLAPPNATWLNMTLISFALSDFTPCFRTLAAIFSALVYDGDADIGSVTAGCIGGTISMQRQPASARSARTSTLQNILKKSV